MKPLFDNMDPEAEEILLEKYRRMTVSEKLKEVQELNQAAQLLALADIRQRYPNADERELQLRLASRWIEPELMREAFGWDPEKEGY